MSLPPLTPPSDRERLIGALVALRNLLESFERLKRGDADADLLEPEIRVSLVRDLLSGADAVCRFPQIAYGLPPSLALVPGALADLGIAAEERDAAESDDRGHMLVDALRAAAAERAEDSETAILQLLDLKQALESDVPMPAAVAEARGLSRRSGLAAAGLATAPTQTGPDGAEARRRWERADVVVVRPGASWELGAVVGLDIDPSKSPGVHGGRVTEMFRESLRDGARAAAALLGDLGIDATWALADLSWRIAGIPGSVPLEENSAALVSALAVIRRASQLSGEDLGPIRGVASGSLELKGDRWIVQPLSRKAVHDKVKLIQRDLGPGVVLIARSGAAHPGVARVMDLADAALAAWGDGWTDWATQRLEPSAWSVARGSHGPDEAQPDGLSDCPSPDLEAAATYFRSGPVAAVLGDLPRSGRTTLARQLVTRLKELEAIVDAVWIAPPTALPAGERVFDVLPVALAEALRPYGSARVLVIVEDLRIDHFATEGRNVWLDEELAKLAADLGQPVLAVAQYTNASTRRWRTNGIQTFRAWGDTVDAFVAALIAANGTLSALSDDQITMAGSVDPRDLGLFRGALRAVAAGAGDRDDIVTRLLAPLEELPADIRPKLRLVGACSLLGMPLAADAFELHDVPDAAITSAGAHLIDGGWRIPSPWLAARVASATAGPAPPSEVAALMRGPLDRRLHPQAEATTSPELMLLGIARGAARLQDGRLEEMVDMLKEMVDMLEDGDRLLRWTERLSAPTISALLDILGDKLGQRSRTALYCTLVEKTVRPEAPPDIAQLAAALTVLRRWRGTSGQEVWRGEQDEAVETVWAKLQDGLAETVKRSFEVDTRASAGARIKLLSMVLRFHLPETRKLLYAQLEHIFGGLERRRAQDYVDARRAIRMLFENRWAWRLIDEDERGLELSELPGVEGDIRLIGDAELAMIPNVSAVKRLLLRPPRKSPIGTWLGWLGLCSALNHNPDEGVAWANPDWDALIDNVVDEVADALDRASIPELTHAIRFLSRYDRATCVRLCNRGQLTPRFAARLSRARSFGERADLIELVRWLHGAMSRDLLLLDGQPDQQLADRLAAEAKQGADASAGSGDLRGIGRFIKACAAVDELFGSPTDGFARAFVDALGAEYVDRAVRDEPRPSLVYHLMEGIVAASPPLGERAAHVGATRLHSGIRRSANPWAARLALSIGALPEIGGTFLATLAAELEVPRSDPTLVSGTLRQRMFQASDPEAATWFQRLAAALDGAGAPLARAFAANLDRDLHRLLKVDAPEDVATMCKLAAATLDRAGDPDGCRTVNEWLLAKHWDWVGVFKRMPDADRAHAGLGAVRSIDPGAAHAIAAELAGNQGFDRSVLALAERNALSAAQLLHVLDHCHAGTGASVLADLSTHGFRWRGVVQDVLYEQDPAMQAQTVRLLVDIGWQPEPSAVRRLGDRWRDLAVTLRSPRALAEILQTAASLPDPFGLLDPVLDGLQGWALGRRVRDGARTDLEHVPALLAALRLSGAEETASSILDVARAEDLHRRRSGVPSPALTVERHVRMTPMTALPSLLDEIDRLEPDARTAAGAAVRTRLESEACRSVVANPDSHWHALGRAAALLGEHVQGPSERPRSLHRGAPGDLLLACAWLRGAPWTEPLVQDEIARIEGRLPTGWVAAIGLALGARAHRSDDQLVTTAITTAPGWALRVLLDRALVDRELSAVLEAHGESLVDRTIALDEQALLLKPEADAAAAAIRGFLARTPNPQP